MLKYCFISSSYKVFHYLGFFLIAKGKDLSNITLAQLLNSLQVQEQQRVIREERFVQKALLIKHEDGERYKKNMNKQQENVESSFKMTTRMEIPMEDFLLVNIATIWVILYSSAGEGLMVSVVSATNLDMKL